MTIIATSPFYQAGALVAAGATPLNYSADVEADLVRRGVAAYSGANPERGGAVPAFTVTDANNNSVLVDPESGGALMVKPGRSVATRILSAAVATVTNQLGNTFSLGAKLADKFDAVRLIYLNNCATQTVGMACAFSTAADMSSNLNSAGTWVTGTMADAAARTSAIDPSWNYSSWVELNGDSQVVYARLYIPSAGNTENTINNFTLSAPTTTSPSLQTGDEWITAKEAGNFAASNFTGFTTTGKTDWSPIVGIQYRARGLVHTVVGVGDSITFGTKTTYPADAFWVKAVRALKLAGFKVESCNLGVSGQTTASYFARAQTALTQLAPSVMIYSPFSPNDTSGLPTDAGTTTERNYLAQMRELAKSAGTLLVPFTGIPKCTTDESTSIWTVAQNNFRQSVNNVARALPYHIDLDAQVATTTATGTAPGVQTGYMATDLLHLSETGNKAAKEHAKSVIKRAISF
ncbi:MAG: SGNH/GDSL hydrolase family protein [Nevskia sp.]|jgi:lysophospholipase L1-like esterase|nr:SGNH/GDSL hydrolase family protein [Nevskia sp.]